MEKTEWFNRPITYNPDKYLLETNAAGVTIIDKNTDTIIFTNGNISMIEQITDNEFIVLYKKGTGHHQVFIFNHLYYDEKTNEIKIIYKNQYYDKIYRGSVKKITNTYIMESYTETTLYNAQTKESITLKNSIISTNSYIDNQGNKYLSGTLEINLENISSAFKDYLSILINIDTLEFDGFYSTHQDRFIPITSSTNLRFIDRYNETLEKEVIHYLKLLEEINKINQEAKNLETINLLIKKKSLKKAE